MLKYIFEFVEPNMHLAICRVYWEKLIPKLFDPYGETEHVSIGAKEIVIRLTQVEDDAED